MNTLVSPLLSRDEAAAYLNIAPKTLATWASVQRYYLPVTKIGTRAMYLRTDLDAFIANNKKSREAQ